jgi:myo-inositol-1(or 4)-monophosphatase
MNAALKTRVAFAHDLIRQAADAARAHFGAADLIVHDKGPNDLVTAADFAIEEDMRRSIGAAFPQDGICGEEFGGAAAGSGFVWLIDPIDGTVNYARGIGYFCNSIALVSDGRPVAAWIFDPLRDELFWADGDGNAFLGDRRLRCAATASLTSAVIGLGFSDRHDRTLAATIVGALTDAGTDYRRLGAGALCLAHVAAGRLDAYVEPHMNPWDGVGGLYIAACAGAGTLDYVAAGGLAKGAPVFAAAPDIALELLAQLPAPFSGAPLHLDNDSRSAGLAATEVVATPTIRGRRLR